MNWLRNNWQVFQYNFQWSDYVWLLNGRAARAAVLVPFLGYAVLFNDYVAANVEFKQLTSDIRTHVFLDPLWRSRLIFLGFFALAIANLLYRFWRPYVLKIGETASQYFEYHLQYSSADVFLEIYQINRDLSPVTKYVKYVKDDWDEFWRDAVWENNSELVTLLMDEASALDAKERTNYADAKKRHESMLLNLLFETYTRENRKKRGRLSICLTFALVGYFLIFLPSGDLCLRVLQVTIWEPLMASV